MIFQLVKKEFLLFWRRPREFIVLLLMPFVLITILGAALSTINEEGPPKLAIKLAIIQKDDIDVGIENVTQHLQTLSISEAEQSFTTHAMANFHPITVLLDDVLQSDELKDLIEVVRIEGQLTEKEAKEFTGVLEIPSQFTEKFYRHAFLGEQEKPVLNLRLNESSSIEGSILKDFFTSFMEELSFWTATQTMGIDSNDLREKLAQEIGQTKTVSEKKEVNSVSYYAIGMSVMFMFYVAGNAAVQAYEEKYYQIFGRVLLANMPIPIFFSGLFLATALVAFLQMNILFGLSALVHGVIWPNVFNYIVVTLLLSLMVGAFAVLIASISYRVHSGGIIQVFSNLIVPVIAFIGGSFVPVSQLGGLFEDISKYSPGGAGISAYYKIMQGYSLGDISTQIIAIISTILLLIIVAFFIQPKRGETV